LPIGKRLAEQDVRFIIIPHGWESTRQSSRAIAKQAKDVTQASARSGSRPQAAGGYWKITWWFGGGKFEGTNYSQDF